MTFFKKNSYNSLSDEEIITLYIQNKDTKIIDELYKRYSHLVFGVCLKYLKQKENAEDMTLTLFSQLTDKFEKYTIQHFKSWLYMTSKNSCLMELRKKNPNFVAFDHEFVQVEDQLKSTEIKELKLNLLENAIEELNTDQRFCIQAFYIAKKSYDEIVQSSSYTLNEVKSNIQNGKRNLKLILTKRYAEL